jgi:hypothetical protein
MEVMNLKTLLCLLSSLISIQAFPVVTNTNGPWTIHQMSPNDFSGTERRSVLIGIVFQSIAFLPATASEMNQPTSNEFKNVSTQAPAPEGENPFVTLPNGVKIKDFRIGTGDEVKRDSTVQIQASGRLLNLNGEVFYNTKNNNPDGFGAIPLTIKLNNGEAVPGLEAGLIGMKKGGIRRIIVPPDLAYSRFPNLEPRPMNANDQRTLDSVVKNPRRDATILFDVSIERFK